MCKLGQQTHKLSKNSWAFIQFVSALAQFTHRKIQKKEHSILCDPRLSQWALKGFQEINQ